MKLEKEHLTTFYTLMVRTRKMGPVIAVFPAPPAVVSGETYALAVTPGDIPVISLGPEGRCSGGRLFYDDGSGTLTEVATERSMVFATAVA